jgi:16S rRNA (uracil1498-N3)-methyltransferase
MPYDRFYIDAPLKKEDTVLLAETELHHLAVSRARVGQSVELINGKGRLANATLLTLDKREARLKVDSAHEESHPSKQIILAQGLPRMNHLEWIVEKGTELGVSQFWFFPGHLSEKDSLSSNQQTRLQHLLLSAVKQCGRLHLPEIVMNPSLETWEPLTGTVLFADPSEEVPFLWQAPIATLSPIILFIGPESGFAPREAVHLVEVLKATKVRLHTNTLRTETASLAGLSLLQSL